MNNDLYADYGSDYSPANGYETYPAEICPICGDELLFANKNVSAEYRECMGCRRNTEDDPDLVIALRRR